MLRLMLFFLSAAILALLAAAIPARAQDENMLLHDVAFGPRQRPAVPFPHGRHAQGGLDCTRCHHRFEAGKNLWQPGDATNCAGCHDTKVRGGTPPRLQRAWHTLLDCHKKELNAGRKSGFVTCGGCHRKPGGA